MSNALILSIIYVVVFIVYTIIVAGGAETALGAILVAVLGVFLVFLPCRLFFEICI